MVTVFLIAALTKSISDPLFYDRIKEKSEIFSDIFQNVDHGSFLIFLILFVCFFYIFKNSFQAFEVYYSNYTIQKIHLSFQKNALKEYSKASLKKLFTLNTSDGFSVIVQYAEYVFTFGLVAVVAALSEMFVVIVMVLAITFLYPKAFLFSFGIGVIVFFILKKYVFPKFYKTGLKMQEASTLGNKKLLEFFQSFKEIVLCGNVPIFIDDFSSLSQRKLMERAKYNFMNTLPRMVLETIFVVFFCTTTLFLYFQYENLSDIFVILAIFLYLGFRLMPSFNRIISSLNTFRANEPYLNHLYEFYHLLKNNKQDIIDYKNFTFHSDLTLKNVCFSYDDKKNTLNNISLNIKKGQCIGIAGKTGSGKSTLINILVGLFSPNSGSVLIDGKFEVNSHQWRKRIGFVPQNIYLLDDTIEKNIALGAEEKDINKKKIQEVLKLVALDELVNGMPLQEKTKIGENGVRLSGGEKQRLAIARALYKDPEVIIFDEATSALDELTESQIMKTIHEMVSSRTIIMIAHRLTTLKNCDKIYIINKGCLEQEVTYDTLRQQN